MTISTAIHDLQLALGERSETALRLGWVDIAQRYRRSKLGPFWITISMAVTILGMGLVFGTLFGINLRDFLPFLAIGMITWTFIVSVITEATTTFVSSEGIIKQIKLPYFTYIFRMIWRNTIIFGHNILILPVVMLVFLLPFGFVSFLAIPGFAILCVNLAWLSLVLAVICTRYRDLTQIIVSGLQLWFFVTPIIWLPSLMIEKGRLVFLNVNPFYHLIEVVRAPLLGQIPNTLSWVVCTLMAILGWFFALWFFGKYQKRIAYWL